MLENNGFCAKPFFILTCISLLFISTALPLPRHSGDWKLDKVEFWQNKKLESAGKCLDCNDDLATQYEKKQPFTKKVIDWVKEGIEPQLGGEVCPHCPGPHFKKLITKSLESVLFLISDH